MERTNLSNLLNKLQPGSKMCLSFAMYEIFFPPGEPSDASRRKCKEFASRHHCTIEFVEESSRIEFFKRK